MIFCGVGDAYFPWGKKGALKIFAVQKGGAENFSCRFFFPPSDHPLTSVCEQSLQYAENEAPQDYFRYVVYIALPCLKSKACIDTLIFILPPCAIYEAHQENRDCPYSEEQLCF